MDCQSQPLPNSPLPDEPDRPSSPSHADPKVSLLQRASRFRAGIKKRHGSAISSKDISDNEKDDTHLMRSRSEPSAGKPKHGTNSSNSSKPESSPVDTESNPVTPVQENFMELGANTQNRKSNRDSTGSSLSEVMASAKIFEGHHNFSQGQSSNDIAEHKSETSLQRHVSTISTTSTMSTFSLGNCSDSSELVFEDVSSSPTSLQTPIIPDGPVTLDVPLSRSLHGSEEDSGGNDAESWNVDDALEGTAQLLGSAGEYFFSVLGHVASSAFSFTQSAVKYLVNYSGVETWHDCDSDEEDYDAFQDAAEDLTPKDRVYHICNELLTTEEAYVEKLGLLVKAKEKAARILNPDLANQMFKDIEVIWEFHHDNLLPKLTDRMKKWLQYEKIGDVMRKLTPFLKLYTEYVKDFQKATAMVDAYEEKNSAFAAALKHLRETSRSKMNRKLKIQAHMMEPIQRVPRYELLLRDYIKRIPPDSADREDAEEALKSVAEAAQHFEEMIKRDSRIGKLMEIQNKLDGGVNIVQPNRELVKEGLLEKVPKKNFSDKYIFLFNDMMLICNRLKLVVTKYKVKHVLNLSDVKVVRGLNLDAPTSFAILCPQKAIELVGSSTEETDAWFEAIKQTVSETRNNSDLQHSDSSDVPNSPKLNGDTNIEEGNLDILWQDNIHISPDEGKSWRKRWCVLKSDKTIHFYRNINEDEESSYLDTGHFEKCYLITTPSRRGPSVCLTSTFHRYWLSDENEDIIDGLYLTLTGQVPDGKNAEL